LFTPRYNNICYYNYVRLFSINTVRDSFFGIARRRLTKAALLQRGMKIPPNPRLAALFSPEADSACGTATMNENLLLTADS
jgi:hypothetical protein